MVGVAAGLMAVMGLLGAGAATRSAQVAQQDAAPAVIRIPRPSVTPSAVPTGIPTATATPEDFAPAGPIVLGELIEIFGTSGDGVRLRSAPNLEGAINGLGSDSDVFQVDQGPIEAEGHVWWYLVNLYDPAQQGWAVADYLRPLQAP
jgi:hypothetical protein